MKETTSWIHDSSKQLTGVYQKRKTSKTPKINNNTLLTGTPEGGQWTCQFLKPCTENSNKYTRCFLRKNLQHWNAFVLYHFDESAASFHQVAAQSYPTNSSPPLQTTPCQKKIQYKYSLNILYITKTLHRINKTGNTMYTKMHCKKKTRSRTPVG